MDMVFLYKVLLLSEWQYHAGRAWYVYCVHCGAKHRDTARVRRHLKGCRFKALRNEVRKEVEAVDFRLARALDAKL